MKKKRKTNQAIKDLHLDKPTSHGGWPHGHSGGYTDSSTPVNKQIADYLEAMGLIDDSNPRAKLSENKLRDLIREVLSESFTFSTIPGLEDRIIPDARVGETYVRHIPRSDGTYEKVSVTNVYEDPRIDPNRPDQTYYDYKITNHTRGTIYMEKVRKEDFHEKYRFDQPRPFFS